jgi:TPP-dependent pyruvate/acetoin dehydrogenase alpha subunit
MSKEPRSKEQVAEEVIRLRLSQMVVNEAYKKNAFKVPIHLAMGHEAIAVALSEVMEDGDQLLPTHRNIAYNLARAGTLKPILDEYLIKPSGLSGGKFGSMNLINPKKGIPYASSILGNQLSVATGVAMAGELVRRKYITMVMAGDGSIEEGSFYESMLMARSMKLPVLFIVENNEWSMSTSIEQRRSGIDLSLLSESLDIRYVHLEGNDVYIYRDTLREIREFALNESVPVCIEVMVSTLGDHRAPKTPEHPDGRLINYHSGPASEVILTDWPVIKESNEDPVFALTNHFDRKTLEIMAKKQNDILQKETA